MIKDRPWFFVSFVSELTPSDRDALKRPDWTLYEDAENVSDVWVTWGDAPSDVAWRHFLRLPASGERDAIRSVVDALGYAPDGLRAFPAREEKSD